MKRRNFLKISAAGAAALQFPHILRSADLAHITELPKRQLGKTGRMVSVVGFGGIALRNNGQDFANELIAAAYDRGIRYFDIAPSYGDSQELMGPALKPYRKGVFLACKTQERMAEGADKELHESLDMLKTDHLDLYQLHALSKMEDLEKAFGPNGCMEVILKAQKDGKISHIGFSAHNEAVALKAMDMFDFDTILYPINCVCWHKGHFGPQVYETARKKNMGIMAIKAVATSRVGRGERMYPNMWYTPYVDDKDIENSLRFTLSKDITGTVHGGDAVYMKKTLQFVHDNPKIKPPAEKDIQAMIRGVKPLFEHPAA